jgi:hypothetical protein
MTVNEFVREYEAAMQKIAPFLWFTRPSDVMVEPERRAQEWAARACAAKEEARSNEWGEIANLMLSLQCFASCIASQFEMYQRLKSGQPDAAWDALVDAQEYIQIAIQADDHVDYRVHSDRLRMAEELLFPRPAFQSCGIVYRAGNCTICGRRFDSCEHEEGSVYIGRLCREVNRRDIKLNEISLVPEPRDKRCRVVAWEDDEGVYRNWFTWEKVQEEEAGQEVKSSGGRRIAGYAYRFETLRNV